MSTNFAKTLVWKQDYDVILWRHKQRTPNTNDYPLPLNETPPWKVSAYATDRGNYVELLNTLAANDERLARHLETTTTFSGISNIIQNDLIAAIGDVVRYDMKEISAAHLLLQK